MIQDSKPAPILPRAPTPGGRGALTVYTHKRQLHVYQLTEEELDALHDAGNYKTIDIALFSISISTFSALLTTLITVDIQNTKTFAAFVTVCVAALFGSVFFGARAWMAWKAAKSKLATIKRDDAE
jgi:hypothetical protein